jgi:hypothetical protein
MCEVAKLHQRDVEKEISSREITNQAKPKKINRLGWLKRFVILNFSSNQAGKTSQAREAFS